MSFRFRLFSLDYFDIFCLLLLIPITWFALTPSSYGIVLNIFGYDSEGLVWGKPRAIRSDEWAVWTPYIQMAVLNSFERFNELSTYQHDLRGFNAVPLADWALVFKPLMWPFWLFDPARAFAMHHGLVIVTFLLGWKRLLARCLADIDESKAQHNIYAAFFSVLIFFTGFVQFWWTTLGPILALSPWLLLVVLQWKHSVFHYLKLFYIASVWLLSHTYPPIIISIAYFGIFLLCVHRGYWWRSSFIQLIFTALASVAAIIVCAFYYQDIIPVMMNTVYPGQRISQGGEGNSLILLSTIFPYMNHSKFSDLLNLNICEIGSVGTLLPIAAVCFFRPNWSNEIYRKACFFSLIFGSIIILWMLFPISSTYGKWLLLDKVPGNRMIFVIGILVNYLALLTIFSGRFFYSICRAFIFVSILLFSYLLPSYLGLIGWFEKSAPEAVAVILILIWIVLLKYVNWFNNYKIFTLFFIVLVPNLVAYAKFNPVQQAYPIFNLFERSPIHKIKESVNNNDYRWVVESGYPGAVLSGLGMNSFTTVLIQPQMSIFRDLYPDMPENEFNTIFNRYAHIMISELAVTPYNPTPDVIMIPLRDIIKSSHQLNYQLSTRENTLNLPIGGVVDSVSVGKDNTLMITGWAWRLTGDINGWFEPSDVINSQFVSRPDVVSVFSDNDLRYAGFILHINNYSKYQSIIKKQGICLVSHDSRFGIRLLETNHLDHDFHCRLIE